ncbi:AraC-type DNA-binding protein [Pseudomonas cuatrocienegasensis]|uniref:AraC-type DNA-binding protein n=1 Tax=Pseudomonas cuatrocienegasensis TaxID=543360 RepID=A0ABY1BMQ5_9PSED|nr:MULTISPECIES: AraC family transcriptional regulator [Pseudomonas]OEC34475.1 AraC family transcriptional regulator [Pseudomonas sp. 21C1]SER20249.1 AraC-type DNA-binding protein [Pseudomonas cuatrocienegasensis]
MEPLSREERAYFSTSRDLHGLELLSARFIEHRYAPHVHDGHVIAVLEAGAERYRYRGAEHLAGAGSIALLNPDEVHTGSKGVEQGWRYRVFYPQPGSFETLLAELDLPHGTPPMFRDSVHQDPTLACRLGALHRLLETPQSDAAQVDALQRQTLWREVMLELLQRYARLPAPENPGQEPRAVAQAKELLASQLAAPPSLEALAATVNLSPFHFARVFRRATGLPPHAWLQQRRLEQARALLRQGCAPLGVALQLGFSDQSHLNRQFKRAYGVTPGEYRRACQR